MPSLRFGSYNEVNFGRGCKVVKTEASGKDLILTFDGKGSGITPDEFAPKMIGKDKNGKLLFGYANRLMSITSRLYYPADVPFTGKAGTKSNWKSRTSDYRYQEK